MAAHLRMVYTAAAVELDDLVGELGDVFHAMGDHNQCGPILLELLQKPPDVFASGGIEARHGFVEHEDGLSHRQDAGDRDAALLASREREGRRLQEGFGGLEVDGAQAVAHASVDLVRRHPEVARAKRDIVEDGLGKQLALGELRHVSNAATKLAAGHAKHLAPRRERRSAERSDVARHVELQRTLNAVDFPVLEIDVVFLPGFAELLAARGVGLRMKLCHEDVSAAVHSLERHRVVEASLGLRQFLRRGLSDLSKSLRLDAAALTAF